MADADNDAERDLALLVASLNETVRGLNQTISELRDELAIQRTESATLRTQLAESTKNSEALRAQLAAREHELAQLLKAFFGQRRERMPSIDNEREGRKSKVSPRESEEEKKAKRARAQEKRAQNRARRNTEAAEEEHRHALARCSGCSGANFADLSPEEFFRLNYRPASLVRERHILEKGCCMDCGMVCTAERPAGIVDGGTYGPGLYAHACVGKCADSMPHHRQAKALDRARVP